MDLHRESFDLRKVNSATKYPSILTYHAMADKGRLSETVPVALDGELIGTEKIDGTNARVVLFQSKSVVNNVFGSYLIGSREDFLAYSTDLLYNPAQGIVCTVHHHAEDWLLYSQDEETQRKVSKLEDGVYVVFGEVYGGNINNAKAYTNDRSKFGFRLFDIIRFGIEEFRSMMDTWDLEDISAWREHGGQPFVSESELQYLAGQLGVELVPRIQLPGPIPTGLAATHEWLRSALPGSTAVGLDDVSKGRPEGLVIRSADRKKIVKIRFEDYERTLRK
jgi:hypothetical protein